MRNLLSEFGDIPSAITQRGRGSSGPIANDRNMVDGAGSREKAPNLEGYVRKQNPNWLTVAIMVSNKMGRVSIILEPVNEISLETPQPTQLRN